MYLLTGGSGALGTELQKGYLFDYWAPSSSELDITSEHSIDKFVTKNFSKLATKVSGVIHCAAYTNVPEAESNRIKAMDANITGTKNISYGLCRRVGLKMIYISTDYVYEGTGKHKETDQIRPINFYAITKALGEEYVNSAKDLIIRTSFKPNGKWKYPKAFDDLYTSADYLDVIVPKIEFLLMECATGIYNVGTERKTVYELARRRTTKVCPMSIKEIDGVRLPSDISMNLDKYNALYDEVCGVN